MTDHEFTDLSHRVQPLGGHSPSELPGNRLPIGTAALQESFADESFLFGSVPSVQDGYPCPGPIFVDVIQLSSAFYITHIRTTTACWQRSSERPSRYPGRSIWGKEGGYRTPPFFYLSV